MKPILLAFTVALFLTGAHGEGLYRWVDKDGKVHYTDLPPPADAKDVQQKRLGDGGGGSDEQLPYATRIAKDKNPVILYVTDCKEGCAPARALLAKRGIPFAEKNPLVDAESATALRALVGGLSVPTLVIGGNPLKGYEETTWQTALDAAGYPRTNPFQRPPAPAKPASPPADAPAAPAPVR